jgi:hypothetical protein
MSDIMIRPKLRIYEHNRLTRIEAHESPKISTECVSVVDARLVDVIDILFEENPIQSCASCGADADDKGALVL